MKLFFIGEYGCIVFILNYDCYLVENVFDLISIDISDVIVYNFVSKYSNYIFIIG